MLPLTVCLLIAWLILEKVYLRLAPGEKPRLRFLGLPWRPKGKGARRRDPASRGKLLALARQVEPEALRLTLEIPDAAQAALVYAALSAFAAALTQRWPRIQLDLHCRCAPSPSLAAEGIFSLTLGQIIKTALGSAYQAKRRSASWTNTLSKPS